MIEEDDIVMLWSRNEKHVCTADGETKKVKGIGIVDTERMIGSKWGTEIDLGKKRYHLLEPSLKEIPDIFDRGAQIVLPRIGGIISTYCDLSSGKRVVEGGAGSGALTAVLSKMVQPDGEVITYESRDKPIKIAERNLKKLGLNDIVKIKKGDVTEDVEEKEIDLFMLDIPEPWEGIDMARKALRNGGFFAAYIPTVNQLEKTVISLKEENYIDIKSFENIERDMVVREGATRPSYDMLAHTGYVIIARKI